MMKTTIYVGLGLLFGLCRIATADITDLINDCNDCHGDDGVSQWSDVPTIAGISAFVLSDALYIYRDEERPCEDSEYRQGDTSREVTDMCKVVAEFSDDDIEALAEHYAELEFVAAQQEFDAALVDQGKVIHDRDCENCHADNGRDPEEDAGVLAGQWMDYMREQFEHYAEGSRGQPEKMEEKLEELTDEDVEALLHFYASFQ